MPRFDMSFHRKAKISTFGSQITSAISVALVLLLLGLMAMALVTSHRLADEIRSNVSIIAKVLPGATDVETDRVQRLINRSHGVAKVSYSSPEKILADESALMGEDLSEILDQNPFGGEFEISVDPGYVNSDSIEVIAAALREDPSVDEVVTETAVVDSINSVLGRLSAVLLVAAVALLVISFVLINNTVSLAVYSRRFIIHTMKLVGATGAFIRRPFLIAGLLTGGAAALLSIACVAGIRVYATTFDPLVDELLDWPAMAWIFAAMIALGPLICVAASAMATNRYLRLGYDDMFKS